MSWSVVYDDGRPEEFPMGRDGHGFVLPTPDGHVSATIMYAGKGACFAYAGRYEVKDGAEFQAMEVSTDAGLIGRRSIVPTR